MDIGRIKNYAYGNYSHAVIKSLSNAERKCLLIAIKDLRTEKDDAYLMKHKEDFRNLEIKYQKVYTTHSIPQKDSSSLPGRISKVIQNRMGRKSSALVRDKVTEFKFNRKRELFAKNKIKNHWNKDLERFKTKKDIKEHLDFIQSPERTPVYYGLSEMYRLLGLDQKKEYTHKEIEKAFNAKIQVASSLSELNQLEDYFKSYHFRRESGVEPKEGDGPNFKEAFDLYKKDHRAANSKEKKELEKGMAYLLALYYLYNPSVLSAFEENKAK